MRQSVQPFGIYQENFSVDQTLYAGTTVGCATLNQRECRGPELIPAHTDQLARTLD